MTDKKLALGIVIGVVLTATICYIIYLENQNKILGLENDLLKQRSEDNADNKIISVNSVPKLIRHNFKETIKNGTKEIIKETYRNSLNRLNYLKNIIENRDGYRIFYNKHKPIIKERDLHVLYDMLWFETKLDVNKEVNNGRGPVDFKVSYGLDQTLIEFKLASNTKLKNNLIKQSEIYARANHHPEKIIVIIFVTETEEIKLNSILTELKLIGKENIITIDARKDNKPSASRVKSQIAEVM